MHKNIIDEYFIKSLSRLYKAETLQLDALASMQKSTEGISLIKWLELYCYETSLRLERIRIAAKICGCELQDIRCSTMEDLAHSLKAAIGMEQGDYCNKTLIAILQEIKHREFETYELLAEKSRNSGHPDAAALLLANQDEDQDAYNYLSDLALMPSMVMANYGPVPTYASTTPVQSH